MTIFEASLVKSKVDVITAEIADKLKKEVF
jgi:hypothetical protein